MRSLVAGGAGFLGSHLCEYLIEKGHEVVCIDNLITGKTNNLKNVWNNENFKFIEHDVTNPTYYEEKIDRFWSGFLSYERIWLNSFCSFC